MMMFLGIDGHAQSTGRMEWEVGIEIAIDTERSSMVTVFPSNLYLPTFSCTVVTVNCRQSEWLELSGYTILTQHLTVTHNAAPEHIFSR